MKIEKIRFEKKILQKIIKMKWNKNEMKIPTMKSNVDVVANGGGVSEDEI